MVTNEEKLAQIERQDAAILAVVEAVLPIFGPHRESMMQQIKRKLLSEARDLVLIAAEVERELLALEAAQNDVGRALMSRHGSPKARRRAHKQAHPQAELNFNVDPKEQAAARAANEWIERAIARTPKRT